MTHMEDTCTIHVMSDTKGYIRGYVSRALLAGALGYPQTPEIRVPHVSRMYPACIPHVSIHIRYISLWMHLGTRSAEIESALSTLVCPCALDQWSAALAVALPIGVSEG